MLNFFEGERVEFLYTDSKGKQTERSGIVVKNMKNVNPATHVTVQTNGQFRSYDKSRMKFVTYIV
jgi:hypothetical protein